MPAIMRVALHESGPKADAGQERAQAAQAKSAQPRCVEASRGSVLRGLGVVDSAYTVGDAHQPAEGPQERQRYGSADD
jgi:hypothetical protein